MWFYATLVRTLKKRCYMKNMHKYISLKKKKTLVFVGIRYEKNIVFASIKQNSGEY